MGKSADLLTPTYAEDNEEIMGELLKAYELGWDKGYDKAYEEGNILWRDWR